MNDHAKILLGLAAGAALFVSSCAPTDKPIAKAPPRNPIRDVAATGDPNQIAAAGHGALFDADMRRIILNEKALIAMQDGLAKRLDGNDAMVDPGVLKLLGTRDLGRAERYWLRAAIINSKLAKRDDKDAQQLRQVNFYLLQHSWRFRDLQLRPERLERLRELLGLLLLPYNATDYIRRCREAGVPIPPDFSTTSANWVDQGRLSTNLLGGSDYAGVFTYHDRTVRGACVALPRESGNAGSPAGIICQSATTGAACFWDNKLRSAGPSAPFLGWRNLTLRIADLQDGDNLSDNCTRCHSGNNVYLVTPDDPTWGRLLRRSMAGVDHGNFTLRVRSSTDNSGPAGSGGPQRYVPISAQGWTNQSNAPGCANGCHEGVTATIMATWSGHSPAPPTMPPACASGGVANCYVDPF